LRFLLNTHSVNSQAKFKTTKMKKLLLPAFLFISAIGASQIKMESTSKPESNTQGLFVKGGTQKITSLECYNFKDLVIAFDIDDSFFGYDQIVVGLVESTADVDKSQNGYSYTFTKEDFARRFKGKKYAYLNLFPDANLESKSVMNFERADLQYVMTKKEIETTKLFITVYGGMKTGEVQVIYENNREVRKEKYSEEKLTKLLPITLHNLLKYHGSGGTPTLKIEGDCYN